VLGAGAYFLLPEDPPERPAKGWFEASCDVPLKELVLMQRGTFPGRSHDITFLPREPHYVGSFVDATHSGPWPYLQDVPIVFYGPGFIRTRGLFEADREVTAADIAPTLAELIGTQMPEGRPGKVLDEVLLPPEQRAGRPRLILTIVWDGGGWNVLNEYPDAWPNYRSLMNRGAAIRNATVGSSPSITPSIHTNIGTGAWPDQHGIVSIPLRDGNKVVDSFSGKSAKYIKLPTLADLYDPATGNAAKIGVLAYRHWHLSMIGKGASHPGGDKDLAILVNTNEEFVTNTTDYEMPTYLDEIEGLDDYTREADELDGKLDDKWMREDMTDPEGRRDSPAWVWFQNDLIREVLPREGFGGDDIPDLFFTNYKFPDEIGHNWNMISPEMPALLKILDADQDELIESLNETVGPNRWVVVITADHGQTPSGRSTGGWPIVTGEILADIEQEFDLPKAVFQDTRSSGYWLDAGVLDRSGVTRAEISDFLMRYRIEDNVRAGEDIPKAYEGREKELLFEAAFPTAALPRILRCARED
jgi:Type I phosphodiesterase / nucleotide pyrophosphatase